MKEITAQRQLYNFTSAGTSLLSVLQNKTQTESIKLHTYTLTGCYSTLQWGVEQQLWNIVLMVATTLESLCVQVSVKTKKRGRTEGGERRDLWAKRKRPIMGEVEQC